MITSCTTNLLKSIPGKLINSINFLGAEAKSDSEAEFRLVQLGRSIVDAKRRTLDISMSLKASYAASIRNSESRDVAFAQALVHAADTEEAWANVAKDFLDTRNWLNGKLREDYSQAFVQVAIGNTLHAQLIKEGTSREYMAVAFERIRSICTENVPPVQAILACFEQLAEQALICADAIKQFILYSEELQAQNNFSIYRYIFDHLALQAKKPRLFELDEAYFAAQNEFEIFYEAVEQIARQAHTMVPGTHDPEIEYFDLKFTE